MARTRAKIKILQEDIDSLTKEGILNKEASITLAMITARVGLMFVASPFSGFGVGVDDMYSICDISVVSDCLLGELDRRNTEQTFRKCRR